MNAKFATFKKWSKFLLPLMVLALLLAACDPATQPEETPFMAETPLAQMTSDIMVTPVETPVALNTPIVDPTSVVEMPLATPMEDETPVMTLPTVEVTPVVTSEVEAILPDGMTALIRATDLIGMDIVTQTHAVGQPQPPGQLAGQSIGTVSEVLVDMEGEIHYVLFDAGGFLGVAERTTAVRWDMFQIRLDEHMMGVGTVGTPVVGTPGTPAVGTPAAGATPGMGDIAHDQVIILEGNALLVFPGDVTTVQQADEIDPDLLDEDLLVWDRTQLGLTADPQRPEVDQLLPLSRFSGFMAANVDLVNQQGESLGVVDDVIVDLDEGRALYAVVDFGGFLGIGTTTVLVPWEELQLDSAENRFILNIDRDTLETAPTYDWGLWQERIDLMWDQEIRQFWQQRPKQ